MFLLERNKMLIQQLPPHVCCYRSDELMEILKSLIHKNQCLPTMFDEDKLPDIEWLKIAILSLDPSDSHGILRGNKPIVAP